MKNPRLLLSLTAAAALAAGPALHARDSDVARNVIIGSVAGAIIGDAHSNRPGEGAILGAAAGLIFTAATDSGRHGNYHSSPPRCDDRRVVVAAPCPPSRVVIARPAPPCDDRRVVVVRRAPPPRVVVIDRDHCDDRYDTRRDNRHDHDRRDSRDRRDRRDNRDRRDRYDDYAYGNRR